MNREMTFYQKFLFFIGVLKKDKCYCMKQYNGEKYYCYRANSGRWESHQGPFDTKQNCYSSEEISSEQEITPVTVMRSTYKKQPAIISDTVPQSRQVFLPNAFDFDTNTLKKFL
ncbi:MAG: hypothetical protein AABY93_08440 [Bacteroidota bacterium]